MISIMRRTYFTVPVPATVQYNDTTALYQTTENMTTI